MGGITGTNDVSHRGVRERDPAKDPTGSRRGEPPIHHSGTRGGLSPVAVDRLPGAVGGGPVPVRRSVTGAGVERDRDDRNER